MQLIEFKEIKPRWYLVTSPTSSDKYLLHVSFNWNESPWKIYYTDGKHLEWWKIRLQNKIGRAWNNYVYEQECQERADIMAEFKD